MIVHQHGQLAAVRLRSQVSGVTRVIVARTDGIAMYDDVAFEARDGGAALTAAILGLAATSSSSFGLGMLDISVTVGDRGMLLVTQIDAGHVLGVLLEADADLGAATEVALDQAAWLRSRARPDQAAAPARGE